MKHLLLGSFLLLCLNVNVYATPIQFGANYFDFVNADGISWQDAENAAQNSIFDNVNGYLATIISSSENSFLVSQFATFTDFSGAWLGGEVNLSGTGIWNTGPEIGQIFSQGGTAVSGAYANWGGSEPNGSFPSFAYMNIGILNYGISTGQWADAVAGVASSGDPIRGYFVEYSPVVSVSEPEELAMMLLSIPMIGWVVSRKILIQ